MKEAVREAVAKSLLLDTHVLLWIASRDARLGPSASAAIRDGRRLVFVSAATAWEIAIKRGLGKLEAPKNYLALLDFYRFLPLDVTTEHALTVETLEDHHLDPFDRMLVAQARVEDLTLVSHDARLAAYGVSYLEARE